MAVRRLIYRKEHVAIVLCAALLVSKAEATNVLSLCPGGTLMLLCSTSESMNSLGLLRWNVTLLHIDTTEYSATQLVTPVSPQSDLPLQLSNIYFNITRDSDVGTLPLVSILVVNNVTADLNGTIVDCTEDEGLSHVLMSTINIIRTGQGVHPRPPLVNRTSIFEEDGVVVLLEWMQQSGVTYNVTITPQVPIVWVSGTSVKVRVDYNINYNVTISATLCGQNSVDNTLIIFFVRCTDPLLIQDSNSLVRVAADEEPVVYLEGSNITFICPPGLVLTGPSTSRCLENGEWEPDLRTTQVTCKANCDIPVVKNTVIFTYNSTLEGSQLLIWCLGLPNDTAIAAGSAICRGDGSWSIDLAAYDCSNADSETTSTELNLIIAMVLLIIFFATVFFMIGCVSGQVWQKHRQSAKTSESDTQSSQAERTSAVAEHNTIPTEQDHLEMMENVAYGPLKYTTTK